MASAEVECPRCLGGGIVFECIRWVSSGGYCCPDGTQQLGCPGVSVTCPDCSGRGTILRTSEQNEGGETDAKPSNSTSPLFAVVDGVASDSDLPFDHHFVISQVFAQPGQVIRSDLADPIGSNLVEIVLRVEDDVRA